MGVENWSRPFTRHVQSHGDHSQLAIIGIGTAMHATRFSNDVFTVMRIVIKRPILNIFSFVACRFHHEKISRWIKKKSLRCNLMNSLNFLFRISFWCVLEIKKGEFKYSENSICFQRFTIVLIMKIYIYLKTRLVWNLNHVIIPNTMI